MYQVRIHGRGGQGVVTAAEMLSVAAFAEGKHAQAFPSFGSERTGAPVVAYCRIDDQTIRSHEPILAPDAVIIQDPTLLYLIDVFGGLAARGAVLINTARSADELGIESFRETLPGVRVLTVPATELATATIGRPLPNTALLGGFAAMSGQVSLPSIVAAIRERFSGEVAEKNVLTATAAYEAVLAGAQEVTNAPAG